MPVQNTLAHLRRCCDAALEQLYPAGVPPKVMWRYHYEMRLLARAEKGVADRFLLFKEISNAAQKMFSKIYAYGAIQGTMLVYLLGDHDLNPMPAHYYCTSCGYYEEPHSATVGLDLSMADCPQCGKPLRRDGFTLRQQFAENAILGGYFEYGFSPAFYPIGCSVIEKHYRRRGKCAVPAVDWNDDTAMYEPCGMVVLPKGKTMDTMPMHLKVCDRTGILSVDTTHLDEVPSPIRLDCLPFLDQIETLQRESGILFSELPIIKTTKSLLQDILDTGIPTESERRILRRQKPTAIGGIMDCLAANCNVYCNPKKPCADENMEQFCTLQTDKKFAKCFAQYPIYTCESLYELLIKIGYSRKESFDMTEEIRKAQWHIHPQLRNPSLPPKLIWLCAHTIYLSSRITGGWLGLQYLRMAQYLHITPQVFYRTMWGEEVGSPQ